MTNNIDITKKLKIGDTFGSLKQLCLTLGIEYKKNGKEQKMIWDMIGRVYTYERDGYMITITGYAKKRKVVVEVADVDLDKLIHFLEKKDFQYTVGKHKK